MNIHHPTRVLAAVLVSVAFVGAACGDGDKDTTATTAAPVETTAAVETTAVETTVAANPMDGELFGTFALTAGDCTSGVAGSYFQMVQPGGTPEAGPFIPNADSLCTADPNYSLLLPGTDGGLVTGMAQVAPDPAYDASNNGLADMIFQPVKFFGVNFAGAMDPTVGEPMVMAADGVLTADLAAFTAYYGGQAFSQGGSATGTIDPETGAFVLEWTSLISGGSFDGFTGVWHLEGTFTPAD